MESCAKYRSVGLGKRRSEKSLVKTLWSTATDESYTDVELPLKPLLFHVLISRPYDVCPRAAP